MSIDNPLDQVVALIESDDSQNAPELADQIAKLIGELPLPGAATIVKLIRYEKEKQNIENSALLMKTVVGELRRVGADVDNLRRDHPVTREELRRLTLDATRKVEDLRDQKRVERIGKILAHAITLESSDFDKAEEMMRVARDLSDQDVVGLRHLYDTQFGILERSGLQVNVDNVNRAWRNSLPIRIEGIIEAEYLSIFLKLQGFGLATSVERIQTELPPNEHVFALLAKGADFVRYIQGAVGTNSTERAK